MPRGVKRGSEAVCANTSVHPHCGGVTFTCGSERNAVTYHLPSFFTNTAVYREYSAGSSDEDEDEDRESNEGDDGYSE